MISLGTTSLNDISYEELLERNKLIILALMNDGMAHHKDAIENTICEMDIEHLSNEDFTKLLHSTKGHGGENIDRKCSICINFLKNESIH